jgi:hypothetical protein
VGYVEEDAEREMQGGLMEAIRIEPKRKGSRVAWYKEGSHN